MWHARRGAACTLAQPATSRHNRLHDCPGQPPGHPYPGLGAGGDHPPGPRRGAGAAPVQRGGDGRDPDRRVRLRGGGGRRLRRRRGADRGPGPRQPDRLVAVPAGAGPGGEPVPRAVRAARPGHGPRFAARGPADRRARRQHTAAGSHAADHSCPAVPGRAPAVAPLAAGALGCDRGGHRVGVRAAAAAGDGHPGQPDQRAGGGGRRVPEPVRHLPAPRLVQRCPRGSGTDPGGAGHPPSCGSNWPG
jgi:hypothetical protein